ncbi:MAG TPA: DNA replication/repair protein RecF [Steroidobacteraceae bacterium]|nr:DNA replication/repair protein RecF [Steroidobacteraceae bacterium]
MTLSRLQVTDFRCLQSAELELDPQFTLISGPNASGKTSLLEAMYVLGRGRSFRTRRLEHLIRHGVERFVVFGEVDTANRRVPMGVEGSRAGIRAQIDGDKPSSLAELALQLPVQIIDPEVHHLIEEGPSRRRRFLDWGVFHVEQAFVGHWQRYQQVLKQRNAALKARQPRAIVSVWDSDLVRSGELLSAARARYVTALSPRAEALGRNLLGMELSLSYRSGWAKDQSMGEALQQSWAHDQEAAATQIGPHRAELAIRLDGTAVKDRISRGQQKLLAAALLIAQLKLFPEGSPVQPSLLLDDPAAELDDERLAGLIREVSSQSVQLIVTTLHGEFPAFGEPGRRFKMSGGQVSPG